MKIILTPFLRVFFDYTGISTFSTSRQIVLIHNATISTHVPTVSSGGKMVARSGEALRWRGEMVAWSVGALRRRGKMVARSGEALRRRDEMVARSVEALRWRVKTPVSAIFVLERPSRREEMLAQLPCNQQVTIILKNKQRFYSLRCSVYPRYDAPAS